MTECPENVLVRGVIPADQIFGDDEEDTRLLKVMALQARHYIGSFAWCKSVREFYFGDGYAGIVAIFLAHIEPAKPGVDSWLWLVVGDLPPAYLVIDDSKTPSQALEAYIEEMSRWVEFAAEGLTSKEVIPVDVPATPENAEKMKPSSNF